jgi:hypothetical protein
LKELDINTEASPQQMFEQMNCHFGDDTSGQADDGFRQKPLQIASGVLKFMKNAFDSLTDTVQQRQLSHEIRYLEEEPQQHNRNRAVAKVSFCSLFSKEADTAVFSSLFPHSQIVCTVICLIPPLTTPRPHLYNALRYR